MPRKRTKPLKFPSSFTTNALDSRNRSNARRLAAARAVTQKKRFERFKQFIADIPAIISGKKPRVKKHERKIYNAFWSNVIYSMFESIYTAYEQKSEGLTDELGNSWPDLSPYTKAYKKERRGRLSKIQRSKLKRDTPGLLTPRQYAQWKKDFAEHFNKSMRGKSKAPGTFLRDAEIKAAKYAWWKAKKKGAETLLQVLGEQKYPIMMESGELRESLKPGKINPNISGSALAYRKGHPKQIAKTYFGAAYLGTRVEHAVVAEGKGSYRRPLWPRNMDKWFNKALDAGKEAVAKELQQITKDWK